MLENSAKSSQNSREFILSRKTIMPHGGRCRDVKLYLATLQQNFLAVVERWPLWGGFNIRIFILYGSAQSRDEKSWPL